MLFDFKDPEFREANIKRSYRSVIDGLARLMAFATSLSTDENADVENRQLALAIEDLIAFAVHARRLIEETRLPEERGHRRRDKNRHFLSSVEIYTLKPGYDGTGFVFPRDGKSVPLHTLLGIIIHHVNIDIFRDGHQLRFLLPKRNLTMDDIIDEYFAPRRPNKFYPKLIIQSDLTKNAPMYLFDMAEFLSTFIASILAPIVDRCAENDLYLEDEYNNL